MSREQYQIPTSSAQGGYSQGRSQATDLVVPDGGGQARYLCGDCGVKNIVRRSDPIRCRECGCRVLYKERTKRMVQFEAR